MTQKGVTTKLFIGYRITSEVGNSLGNSDEWKLARSGIGDESLQQIHYNEKEYIGMFIYNNMPTLGEIRDAEASISINLQRHCPELRTSTLKAKIFTQLFIS